MNDCVVFCGNDIPYAMRYHKKQTQITSKSCVIRRFYMVTQKLDLLPIAQDLTEYLRWILMYRILGSNFYELKI